MTTLTQPHPKKRAAYSHSQASLENAPEKVIDDLAWLAANICCTPIGLISLLTDGRLWTKSKVGLTAWDTEREFALGLSTVERGQPTMIPDTAQDDRFSRNSWVISSPKIRFYAGLPLIDSDGNILGTLSVMDRLPRQLSREQIYALEVLARQIVSHLEWRTAAGKS